MLSMALKDVFKVSRKTFFDPAAWFGYSSIKAVTRTIWDTTKDLFVAPEAPPRVETFEEAMQRFNLTDANLPRIQQRYFIYALAFVCLGVAVLLYGLYLLFSHHTFAGFLLAV